MSTVVLTGGGSGGHITPILAVAAELKRKDSSIHVIYIGQKGDSLADIPEKDPNIDEVYTVRAGKFRRYHGEGLKQLLDLKTMFLNIRDFFYVCIGIFQSWKLIRRIKPGAMFSRGGFVSVPVALGSKLNGVPYITHDSDSSPSLANKIIGRWATYNAVALSKELYSYPELKTITTGIPLNKHFKYVDSEIKNKFRTELKIPKDALLIFVIGGGLGSRDINTAMEEALSHLLEEFKNLHIIQSAGRGNDQELALKYKELLDESAFNRVEVHDFIGDVYKYSGAADLVITRAGATNLAEFAVQGKACIVIPSSFLAGGHQLKNAKYLEEQGAIEVIQGDELVRDSNKLAQKISDLLKDESKRKSLGKVFSSFAQENASDKIVDLILKLL
ncbi:MAG: UDP-N-acetylglucosamine--N-acetylmuramyl-(pentapeptide) pyrophosphoryl-undecaprenol N-acetylglucosamine transferase [Candidatus Saccharimonadales bacterium]